MTRFDLQDSVLELGESPSQLRKKTVSVVGLGGLGSHVSELLARAGINLRLVDKDRVYEEELAYLTLFNESHLSKFKAKEAKKILEGINKDIKVKAFHEELVSDNAYLVDADVIVDCSNDMKTTLLVDKAAKKKPVVYTRIFGTEAHIYVAQDTRVKQVSQFLEKSVIDRSGVLNSAISSAAGAIVSTVLKLLLGQKVPKSYVVLDTWKFASEKVTVRKNK